MKVVLTKDIKKLGFAGDVVDVAPGYARNYLLPHRFAKMADAAALQKAKLIQAERVKTKEEMTAKSTEIMETLAGITLDFTRKVSSNEHLYGSVSEADIAEALKKQAKMTIEKSEVKMKEHIKELGTHEVSIHLPNGEKASVKVKVEAEESAEEEKEKKKATTKKATAKKKTTTKKKKAEEKKK